VLSLCVLHLLGLSTQRKRRDPSNTEGHPSGEWLRSDTVFEAARPSFLE